MQASSSFFISSTFVDFQRERDILSRLIFPRLRSKQRQLGRELNEIDLRWGVTNAMGRNEGAVNICLNGVQRCSPYIFGMVGHRIGWCPTLKYMDKRFRKLLGANIDGLSLTELELQLAAAVAPSPDAGPIVLQRSLGLTEKVLDDLQSSGVAITREDASQIEQQRTRLAKLPNATVVAYDNFETFEIEAEKQIEQRLALVDHRASDAAGDADTRAFIDRRNDVQRIYRSLRSRPTLVMTSPGAGSSWLSQHVLKHAKQERRVYIDGRTTPIDGFAAAINALEGEPTDRLDIARAVGNWKSDTLIVLDHYEDAFESAASSDLTILPGRSLAGARLLVIARTGRVERQARAQGWSVLQLSELQAQSAVRYLREYLAGFGKHLTPGQREALCASKWINNVGSIRLAADELRRFGSYEKLDERIEQLRRCATQQALASEVLSGVRDTLPQRWRSQVERTLTALEQSVRGLEEDVLRSVGSEPDQPLPQHLWSAIRLSMPSAFRDREGCVDLASGPVRELTSSLADANPSLRSEVAQATRRSLRNATPGRQALEAPNLALASGGASSLEALLGDVKEVATLTVVGDIFASSWLDRLPSGGAERVVSRWLTAIGGGEQLDDKDAVWRMAVVAARAGLTESAVTLANLDAQREGDRPAREVLLAHFTNDAASLATLSKKVFAQDRQVKDPAFQSKAMLVLGKLAEGHLTAPSSDIGNLIRMIEGHIAGRRDAALRAQLDLYKGQIALIAADHTKAAAAFESASSLSRAAGSGRLLCSSLERASAVALSRGKFRKALEAAEECLELAVELGLEHPEALAYERLIEVRMRRADWDKAYGLAAQYLRRCGEGLTDPERARALLRQLESV